MNKVSVIIPNFNGEKFLKPCLDALLRQSMDDFDIIVVDDGSSDGSVKLLKDKYADRIELVEMGRNTGFCGAVNAGVKAAKSEFVILLNNDTVADERFVEELTAAIERRPRAFSINACMLTVQNPEILDGAGDLYNAFGWASARGKGKRADKFAKEKKIFSACGGASIYRRELFVKLGMLDENHFAYLEDLDLGYRARIQGYENWYTPSAGVLHVGSGTSGSRYNEFKVRLSARNNVYVVYKNMPVLQRIINTPFLFIGFSIKKVYFSRKGFGELYVKSLKEGKKLALSAEGMRRRVPYQSKNFKNYLRIQLELWGNMFRR